MLVDRRHLYSLLLRIYHRSLSLHLMKFAVMNSRSAHSHKPISGLGASLPTVDGTPRNTGAHNSPGRAGQMVKCFLVLWVTESMQLVFLCLLLQYSPLSLSSLSLSLSCSLGPALADSPSSHFCNLLQLIESQ